MAIELKIPEVGESITEVEIGDWLKKEGDSVAKDENVVTIESEKATVELPSPNAGKISKILKRKGETAKVGEVIALVEGNGEIKKAERTADLQPSAQPKPQSESVSQKAVQPKAE